MNEETIRDVSKALQRLAFANGDGFVVKITAGRNHRQREFAEQQMMQRRIGQHDAKTGIAGGDAWRKEGVILRAQQHDRRLRRYQERPFKFRDLCNIIGRG